MDKKDLMTLEVKAFFVFCFAVFVLFGLVSFFVSFAVQFPLPNWFTFESAFVFFHAKLTPNNDFLSYSYSLHVKFVCALKSNGDLFPHEDISKATKTWYSS